VLGSGRESRGAATLARKGGVKVMLTKLQEILDEKRIKYQICTHSPAYTAQEIAALQHVPGRQMAKVVMVRVGGKLIMTVLPATHHVDLIRLEKLLGGRVELATEEQFRGFFPGCEVGGEPPFGNLFDIEVWVDLALTKNDEIFFNAGNHRQTIRMRYDDYSRLVTPKVASFAAQK
jgi:Ala-tRNA(Pro) deacylase